MSSLVPLRRASARARFALLLAAIAFGPAGATALITPAPHAGRGRQA